MLKVNLKNFTNKICCFRIFFFCVLFVCIISATEIFPQVSSAIHSSSAYNQPQFVPGQIIIKFRKETGEIVPKTKNGIATVEISTLDSKFVQLGVTEIVKIFPNKSFSLDQSGLSRIYQLKIPVSSDVKLTAAIFKADPNVEYAVPRYVYHTTELNTDTSNITAGGNVPRYVYHTTELNSIPNDSLFPKQWALTKILAPQAWNITKGDTTVKIAILDTGVDWGHPDLSANIWVNPGETGLDSLGRDKRFNGVDDDNDGYVDDWHGWDFVKGPLDPPAEPGEDGDIPDNDPMDSHGHGTHVAGIASGVTNNKIGIAGVGWNCKILPVRVGYKGPGGNGYVSAGPEGLVYAADMGAEVVNMSWGGPGDEFLYDAILYAYNKGVVLVGGAGNGNTDELFFPAAYKEVIAVSATNSDDSRASFSNFGKWVAVSAPGVNIMSTLPGRSYDSWSGTSMATPFVAGLAGLVKSLHRDWSNEQVRNQIIAGADNIDKINPLYKGLLGKGRINAYRTLIENPGSLISVSSVHVLDSFGKEKVSVEPGEKITLFVELDNQWGDLESVVAELATDDYSIILDKGTSYYGKIAGGKQASNKGDPFIISVSNIAHSHVAKFSLNITGIGYTRKVTFNMVIGKPTVLLVDDDGEGNNVESFYTSVLDSIGIAYAYWNRGTQGSPSAKILSDYTTIIWFTAWSSPTLRKDDVSNLKSYLEGGGNLFITGQDIGWDINDPRGYAYKYGREFYANYLHADFVEDNSNSTTISGVPGDPISDGINFDIIGGDGANNQKYPDAIRPRTGATSVFNYSNGKIGGIKYQGNYRVVYLGFGFEGINSFSTRVKVMDKIITWLNGGFSIVSSPISDTEDTTQSVIVTAQTNNQQIKNIFLYYWLNSIGSISRIPMTYQNDNKFIAKIPAQHETDVHYFIYGENKQGYSITTPMNAPNNRYSFHIGRDFLPPVIQVKFDNTIDEIGPYEIRAFIKDNIGVDSNSVFLHYFMKNSIKVDSIQMSKINQNGKYVGFIYGGVIKTGGSVNFFITAKDVSSSKNLSRSPQQGYDTFYIVKKLLIDNFDSGTEKWELNKWGLISTNSISPPYAISNAPSGRYENNENNSLILREGLQLSTRKSANLSFWTKYQIAKGDSGSVEISSDSGLTWNKVSKVYNGLQLSWKNENISLDQYCGRGKVYIRFRFSSDSTGTGRGWYLDDISISVDTILTTIAESSNQLIPKEFFLSQNYPNPFNPSTKIRFSLPSEQNVSLKVYNVLGQEVASLVNEQIRAGSYEYEFNASKLSSGVYFYILKADSYTSVKKMIFLK